jgi:hypothetical protein
VLSELLGTGEILSFFSGAALDDDPGTRAICWACTLAINMRTSQLETAIVRKSYIGMYGDESLDQLSSSSGTVIRDRGQADSSISNTTYTMA